MSEYLREVKVLTLAAAESMAAAAEAFALARGWTTFLSLGAVALEGGLPVRVNRQVADAGLEALQV